MHPLTCLATATLCVLTACQQSINVREQWGSAITNFGLDPVYPMRENMYLGDIYLYLDNPCRGSDVSNKPQSLMLGSLPEKSIQQAFADFYGSRPQLPLTPAKTSTSPPAAGAGKPATPAPVPNNQVTINVNTTTAAAGASGTSGGAAPPQDSPPADAKTPIFGAGRTYSRQPMAAMPAVSLYSYVGGSAGGVFGSVSAAFGGQRSENISITANQIEVAELPAPVFARLVNAYIASPDWASVAGPDVLKPLIDSFEYELMSVKGCQRKSSQGPGPTSNPRIVFINSVYYTRNLVYEYGENSAFAAKLAVTASVPAGATSSSSTSYSPPGQPATPSGANAAQVSAQSLLTSLGTMSGGPGGGGSIAVGSGGNLALNQTFARPMAFATQHSIIYGLSASNTLMLATPNSGPPPTPVEVSRPWPPQQD